MVDMAGKFAAHHVDALVFGILTEDDLVKMGIKAVGDQRKILGAASELFSQRQPPKYSEK